MAYYLRKENKKKGYYLQMYESHWDKEKKQPSVQKCHGFWLCARAHLMRSSILSLTTQTLLQEKNKERAAAFTEETRPRAFVTPVEYNLGQFLLYTLLEELNVKEVIDILGCSNALSVPGHMI